MGGEGGAGDLSAEHRGTRHSPWDASRALQSPPRHELRANWPLQLWAPPCQYQCGLPRIDFKGDLGGGEQLMISPEFWERKCGSPLI